MARVTVIQNSRTLRVSPAAAALHVREGAQVDRSDTRGAEAYDAYMARRGDPAAPPLPPGYRINSAPPWHTVLLGDEKVGNAHRSQKDAQAAAWDHANAQEKED